KRDVRSLTRAAGIQPTTTRVMSSKDPTLEELAPGERSFPGGLVPVSGSSQGGQGGRGRGRKGQSSGRPKSRNGGPQSSSSSAGGPKTRYRGRSSSSGRPRSAAELSAARR